MTAQTTGQAGDGFDSPDGRTCSAPVTAPRLRLECPACGSTGIITVPMGNVDRDSRRECTEPVHDDPFGGHEFAYESHTDLFRCCFCRKYEVVVRDLDTGAIALCPGEADDGAAGGTGDAAPGRDLSNAQFVGRRGDGLVTVGMPSLVMSREEALVHAAWLVLVAGGELEIGGILAAIGGAQ